MHHKGLGTTLENADSCASEQPKYRIAGNFWGRKFSWIACFFRAKIKKLGWWSYMSEGYVNTVVAWYCYIWSQVTQRKLTQARTREIYFVWPYVAFSCTALIEVVCLVCKFYFYLTHSIFKCILGILYECIKRLVLSALNFLFVAAFGS